MSHHAHFQTTSKSKPTTFFQVYWYKFVDHTKTWQYLQMDLVCLCMLSLFLKEMLAYYIRCFIYCLVVNFWVRYLEKKIPISYIIPYKKMAVCLYLYVSKSPTCFYIRFVLFYLHSKLHFMELLKYVRFYPWCVRLIPDWRYYLNVGGFSSKTPKTNQNRR